MHDLCVPRKKINKYNAKYVNLLNILVDPNKLFFHPLQVQYSNEKVFTLSNFIFLSPFFLLPLFFHHDMDLNLISILISY